MQEFTGKYRGIQGFIGVCRSTQGFTGDYNWKGIQRVYRGLQGYKKICRGLQGITRVFFFVMFMCAYVCPT